jgi:DNA sulfur modification protein DndB
MNNKGEQLNTRVWTLFERAGFTTKPGSQSPDEEEVILNGGKKRTIDLSANSRELGVKIIGENTSATRLDEPLSTYIHDTQKLVQVAKAKAGLFVLTNVDISDQDKQYAKQKGILVWGEEELQYYEAVVEAIGVYAKYEIIHSFGIRTNEEKTILHVLALRFNQPYSDSSVDLFLFTITPEKLLKTCAIYRKAQGSGQAYQRMLRRDRLQSVRKFVTQEDALLPPNIIVHFGQKVTWDPINVPEVDANGKPITLTREKDAELVVLKIPMEYASLELIDGQHRLYGFVETEPATKGNFNLVVLGIKELPIDKRRDTFVAINDKSRRMDPNLVAYLKLTDDEVECQKNNELMAIRIVVELNKTDPFKNRIRLLDVGDQKITLRGFSGYDLKGLLGPRGLLRKYCKNETKEYVSALRLYFGIMKSMFKKEWLHPESYIIFTNRGVSAFLKLLKSIIKTCKCPLDEMIVKRYLLPLKDKWSSWETSGLRSAYVGSKGWKDFHHDLVTTIREVYPDFEE